MILPVHNQQRQLVICRLYDFKEQIHPYTRAIDPDIPPHFQEMDYISGPFDEKTKELKEESVDVTCEYKTSIIAWVNLVAVVFVNISCALTWMTVSSSPDVSAEWMEASLSQVNWLSNVSAIINSLLSLTTPWAYEILGLKKVVILAGMVNATGCWIRCIAILVSPDKRYYLVMLGQSIGAIGGPFVFSIATKFVAVWFATKDRGVANAILAIQLGMMISPLIMPELADTPENTPRMLLAVAGIATVVLIPPFLLPGKPKVQPSPSASEIRMPFRNGMALLLKNRNFWLATFLCSSNIGMSYSVSVLVMQAIMPYNYSAQESGICAAVIVLGGFFGGVMTGYWVGVTSQYLMLLKMFAPMSAISYIMLIFQIVPNGFGVIVSACLLIGFFSYAVFPVYLEFSSEITYPVPESLSSSLTWALCTTFMLIFSVLIDALREGPDANPPYNMHKATIVMAVIMCVTTIPVFWLKGDLNRLRLDKREQGNEADQGSCA
ncbi:major facilitator superfamily domain-containing protein [Phycomyces nitens]|nr:major facilitator superfamily domain-containing protein [Phycomyces nitens]